MGLAHYRKRSWDHKCIDSRTGSNEKLRAVFHGRRGRAVTREQGVARWVAHIPSRGVRGEWAHVQTPVFEHEVRVQDHQLQSE